MTISAPVRLWRGNSVGNLLKTAGVFFVALTVADIIPALFDLPARGTWFSAIKVAVFCGVAAGEIVVKMGWSG